MDELDGMRVHDGDRVRRNQTVERFGLVDVQRRPLDAAVRAVIVLHDERGPLPRTAESPSASLQQIDETGVTGGRLEDRIGRLQWQGEEGEQQRKESSHAAQVALQSSGGLAAQNAFASRA